MVKHSIETRNLSAPQRPTEALLIYVNNGVKLIKVMFTISKLIH